MRAPIGVDGLKSKNSIQIRESEKDMDHSIVLKGLVANTAYDIYCHMDNVKDFACDDSSCGISLVITFWTGDSKLITGASLSSTNTTLGSYAMNTTLTFTHGSRLYWRPHKSNGLQKSDYSATGDIFKFGLGNNNGTVKCTAKTTSPVGSS